MSQVTIYLPPELMRDLKQRAKQARSSVSAYLTTLVRRDTVAPSWPAEFLSSFGAWKREGIEAPEALPFERRARLK